MEKEHIINTVETHKRLLEQINKEFPTKNYTEKEQNRMNKVLNNDAPDIVLEGYVGLIAVDTAIVTLLYTLTDLSADAFSVISSIVFVISAILAKVYSECDIRNKTENFVGYNKKTLKLLKKKNKPLHDELVKSSNELLKAKQYIKSEMLKGNFEFDYLVDIEGSTFVTVNNVYLDKLNYAPEKTYYTSTIDDLRIIFKDNSEILDIADKFEYVIDFIQEVKGGYTFPKLDNKLKLYKCKIYNSNIDDFYALIRDIKKGISDKLPQTELLAKIKYNSYDYNLDKLNEAYATLKTIEKSIKESDKKDTEIGLKESSKLIEKVTITSN